MNTNTVAYLEQSLIDAINLAKVTGTNVVSVLSREVPDITEQLVKYNLLKLSIETVGWFLLGCMLLGVSNFCHKKLSTGNHYDRDFAIFIAIIFVVASGAPFIAFVFAGLDLLKLVTAPKLWLLEYAAKLLK